MRASLFVSLCLVGLATCAANWRPTPSRTRRATNPFVTSVGNQFQLGGLPFNFVGTNAYWLPTLNSVQDINNTLHSIKAANIHVVRVWGFNDVDTIPVNGTWFQLIQNGTFTINTGTNGLQRLDTVVQLAEAAGMHVIISLTNNWNPLPLLDNTTSATGTLSRRDVTVGTNNSMPRNFLSNDYGGMDAYVRELGVTKQHDEFYTNATIIAAFKNYTDQIVSRYIDSPAVLSWELANDPRCNSSIAGSDTCNTTTVTLWHQNVAEHIQQMDRNHLISSGTHGFMCMDCMKLFATPTPTPTPAPPAPAAQVSAQPVGQKRSATRKRSIPVFSKITLLRDRALKLKTRRATRLEEEKRSPSAAKANKMMIRGRWSTERTHHRRQSVAPDTAFDGAHGVDSQDILAIPQIGFSTFQLFPDQNVYGPTDPNLPAFNNTVQQGLDWIQAQAQAAQAAGKPSILTGFGLVTNANLQFFVPFNSSVGFLNQTGATTTSSGANGGCTFPIISAMLSEPSIVSPLAPSSPIGVTNAQQDDAYSQWIQAAANNGVTGAIQYQWGQQGLLPLPGTTVSPNQDSSGTTPNIDTSGVTPNDGYSISPTGQDGVISVLFTRGNATNLFGI